MSRRRREVWSWWWVFSFMALCFTSYAHASKKKIEECERLHGKVEELTRIRDRALLEKEGLLLEIQSQSDPQWIQMVLMRKLGLVPEGQKKIVFSENGQGDEPHGF